MHACDLCGTVVKALNIDEPTPIRDEHAREPLAFLWMVDSGDIRSPREELQAIRTGSPVGHGLNTDDASQMQLVLARVAAKQYGFTDNAGKLKPERESRRVVYAPTKSKPTRITQSTAEFLRKLLDLIYFENNGIINLILVSLSAVYGLVHWVWVEHSISYPN